LPQVYSFPFGRIDGQHWNLPPTFWNQTLTSVKATLMPESGYQVEDLFFMAMTICRGEFVSIKMMN
jgi:hypothetical protein